jgi:hypothetical protein
VAQDFREMMAVGDVLTFGEDCGRWTVTAVDKESFWIVPEGTDAEEAFQVFHERVQ